MMKEFFSEILLFHSLLFRVCMDSGGDGFMIVARVGS